MRWARQRYTIAPNVIDLMRPVWKAAKCRILETVRGSHPVLTVFRQECRQRSFAKLWSIDDLKETRLTSDCAYQCDLFSRSLEQPEQPDLSVDRQSIFLQPPNQVSDPVFQHARMLQLKSRQRQRGFEF